MLGGTLMGQWTGEYMKQMIYYVKIDMLEILQKVIEYLPYNMLLLLLVLFFFQSKRTVGTLCFLQYIVIVGYITLLSREPGSRQGVDFTVFATWGMGSRMDAFVVENVLLFIPIGLLLPLIGKRFRNIGWCLAAGGVISAMIEGIQYVTQRGFVQLEDIVTNVMGTLVGFFFFFIIRWIYQNILEK